MPECLFCRIVGDEIPVVPVYRDEQVIAFRDVSPQAPSHFLFIPRQHFTDITEVPTELLGHLMKQAAAFARENLPAGFRVVINTGEHGGQTVMHVHVHVLGGRALGWPPG